MGKYEDKRPDFVPAGKNPPAGFVVPNSTVTLSPTDRGADFVKAGETVKTNNGHLDRNK